LLAIAEGEVRDKRISRIFGASAQRCKVEVVIYDDNLALLFAFGDTKANRGAKPVSCSPKAKRIEELRRVSRRVAEGEEKRSATILSRKLHNTLHLFASPKVNSRTFFFCAFGERRRREIRRRIVFGEGEEEIFGARHTCLCRVSRRISRVKVEKSREKPESCAFSASPKANARYLEKDCVNSVWIPRLMVSGSIALLSQLYLVALFFYF